MSIVFKVNNLDIVGHPCTVAIIPQNSTQPNVHLVLFSFARLSIKRRPKTPHALEWTTEICAMKALEKSRDRHDMV